MEKMEQKINIKEMVERFEKPSKSESFLLAAKVAIIKNKDLLDELAK